MTYELAKQLKDAGFPKLQGYDDGYVMMNDGLWPNLSELISALGDNQFRLLAYYSGNDLVWQADQQPFNVGPVDRPNGEGSTPEEAVARLWLALNAS